MTYEELLAKIDECPVDNWVDAEGNKHAIIREMTDWQLALRAVVEIHKPQVKRIPCPDGKPGCAVFHFSDKSSCSCGFRNYPCPTIQAIERELK